MNLKESLDILKSFLSPVNTNKLDKSNFKYFSAVILDNVFL
jgi:hypothetical protein